MPVTALDVLDAARAAWAAHAGLAAVVPADRVYTGRDGEGTPAPRATLACSLIDARLTTGPSVLFVWRLAVTLYAADPAQLAAAAAALPAAVADISVATGLQTLPPAPLPADGPAVTGERQGGADLTTAECVYRVAVESATLV